MNSLIKKAYQIAEDKESYPTIIGTIASIIAREHVDKREHVKALWENHQLFQFWISARRGFRDGKTNGVQRARNTTVELRKQFGREKENLFHTHRHGINSNKSDIVLQCWVLKNLLAVLNCQDIGLMLRYIECVNLKQKDETLGPVGFIRHVTATHVAEIITWRLIHKK